MTEANNNFDVAIAGGGVAGCAAALWLTQLAPGARVLLIEKGNYPRHKVCGEFVSAAGVAALHQLQQIAPALYSVLQNPQRISSSRIFLDGKTISAPLNPAAYSITRNALD